MWSLKIYLFTDADAEPKWQSHAGTGLSGVQASTSSVSMHECLCLAWPQALYTDYNTKKMRSESHSAVSDSAAPWTAAHGSSVHGILQVRILEWVAFPFSRGSSQPRSPVLQADSLPSGPPGMPYNIVLAITQVLALLHFTDEETEKYLRKWK